MTGCEVRVREDVAEALEARRPVVALETAVLTTGLPRLALEETWTAGMTGWRPGAPANLETVRLLARTVREGGAVPAVVAVVDGVLRIGLDEPELERLAADVAAGKTSARDLPQAMVTGGSAGTTVSATLAACAAARPLPIRVFATGGIGGVHRGWIRRPDVSADLVQLARTACCVVCAGAKSILDTRATVEALETLGVPVVGYRTDCWPQFFAAPDDRLRLADRVDDVGAMAARCRARWETLGCGGGLLLAVPAPEDLVIDRDELERATAAAEAEAAGAGVDGAAVTPFLLAALADRTQGRTLRANVELLRRNASVAASLAVTLAESDA